jgi:preprotein translocase subunit YajC
MPGAGTAEIYFIAVMMFLILVFSFAVSYFFIRQYRKEMREKREHDARSNTETDQQKAAASTDKKV